MTGLRPFFCYYGGKWRAAPRYPAPTFGTIVEPFAGAAGYATRYADRDVVLVERDPHIAELWRWLIAARPSDVRALPLVDMDDDIRTMDIDVGARTLIGFWLNKGTAAPCYRPSSWMRAGRRPKSYWGPEVRDLLATQVSAINHWRVIEGSWESAPDVTATWFVDPPYNNRAGRLYRHSSVDYARLAAACRSRFRGQVIVCENVGATWLPFRPFARIKSNSGPRGRVHSHEAIWERHGAENAREETGT